MAVTQPDPFVGHEIDGYLIEKMLGKGGMARVYRAQDVHLGRYVAVKVIEPNIREDQEYTRRFEKEARAVAQLQHPNIVNIYRFGQASGLYYMAMQFIDGVDLGWVLSDYARDKENMPYQDVLHVVTQIGAALDYAHGKGVIHRDVKPTNIMLDKEGNAILADFGLALVQIEGTRGEIFGTPHYIAPEQAVNSAGSVPQSDQYSLGVILYQMLTGSLPYDGQSAMDIAMAHMSDPLPSPLERNPDLNPAFVSLLEKVLQKEPSNRYESCAALAEDLKKAVAAQARRPSTAARISLADVSHQVDAFRAANPLPPLPAIVSSPATNTPTEVHESPIVTKPASAPVLPNTRPHAVHQRQMWVVVSIISTVIILLGIIVIGVLLSKKTEASTVATSSLSSPTSTFIASNTTEAVVAASTNAVQSSKYTVLIATYNDNLFVMNLTAEAFPLALLSLGDGSNAVNGTDWGLDAIKNGECVSVRMNQGDLQAQGMTCGEVGNRLSRVDGERFWGSTFNIYYRKNKIATCDPEGCLITIIDGQ